MVTNPLLENMGAKAMYTIYALKNKLFNDYFSHCCRQDDF